MARVTFPMGIEKISGRVGNVCFRTMKATGKVYVGRMPEGRRTMPEASELKAREVFKKRAELVSLMRKMGSRLSTKQLWQLAAQAV